MFPVSLQKLDYGGTTVDHDGGTTVSAQMCSSHFLLECCGAPSLHLTYNYRPVLDLPLAGVLLFSIFVSLARGLPAAHDDSDILIPRPFVTTKYDMAARRYDVYFSISCIIPYHSSTHLIINDHVAFCSSSPRSSCLRTRISLGLHIPPGHGCHTSV